MNLMELKARWPGQEQAPAGFAQDLRTSTTIERSVQAGPQVAGHGAGLGFGSGPLVHWIALAGAGQQATCQGPARLGRGC